ncbi:MAG: TolC family protein [Bacteroidia bacterium]|jgi:outer membrane protein|nr:TolC family protein [Bacteroidia bacterium]
MNNKLTRSLALFLSMFWIGQSTASNTDPKDSFSLQDAISYALEHNPELRKARMDVSISKETVKQTVAIGLPQISATGSYSHYLTIPGNWIKNFAPTPGSPEYIFLQFQQKINSSGTIGVNQLLFDGSYLVGLKATKEFVDMSRFLEAKTAYDVQVNVSKAYLMIASTDLNIKLINANIKTLEKSLSDLKAMFEEGFVEDLDVKRVQLSLNNILIQKETLSKAREAFIELLKVQMGMDLTHKLFLKDDIESIDRQIRLEEERGKAVWTPISRPEYQILDQSIRLGKLDKKRYQMGYLPKLVGFYQHQQSTMRPEFNFFESNLTPNNNWIPSDMLGLQVQLTLFDGLQAQSKIREIQYKIDKAETDLEAFSNAASVEWRNARNNYQLQLKQAALQKENMDLAEEIYNKTQIKFKEGVGSTLEITQAEGEFKSAQVNYLNAIYDLVIAKIDYHKAIGKPIK